MPQVYPPPSMRDPNRQQAPRGSFEEVYPSHSMRDPTRQQAPRRSAEEVYPSQPMRDNTRQYPPPRRSGESARGRRPPRDQPFAGVQEEQEAHRKRKALKNHMVAASGEFVGTFLFLWFAFAGTQVAAETNPRQTGELQPQSLNYICLSFGVSLLAVVWAFYRISGGLFNPAVTLALCICGAVPWIRGICFLFPAQLLGGIVAAALVDCMFPGDASVFRTRLANGTTPTQGVFIEMFLTSLLIFVILMLAVEKHHATFVAPVGIGLAFYVCELAGVYWTGGSLNPARSFGPDVAMTSFPEYHYIYWFGPIMGALLASGYYRFVKIFDYEEVNPGQDATTPREEKKEKERHSPA